MTSSGDTSPAGSAPAGEEPAAGSASGAGAGSGAESGSGAGPAAATVPAAGADPLAAADPVSAVEAARLESGPPVPAEQPTGDQATGDGATGDGATRDGATGGAAADQPRRPRLRRDASVADLVAAARDGDPRAVARLISLVEDANPRLREVAAALARHTGGATIIGLTGSPGVGKSTTTSALVSEYRRRGKRVGVLAVDPSSPFSGGALLGDRVRMQDHASDPGVFIRSMASRGHLGGLSWATPQALRVLDGAGCDVVLVETVGVGQAEVEIASLADTTLVLLAPGMGDGIQAAKAGILEVADAYVVNKADRDGADQVVRDLKGMLGLGGRHSRSGAWRPPIVKTVAAKAQGLDEVVDAVEKHRSWMEEHGELRRRQHERAAAEIEALAVVALRAEMKDPHTGASLGSLADQVVAGECDPYAAADRLVEELRNT